jgi:hypothetical protein
VHDDVLQVDQDPLAVLEPSTPSGLWPLSLHFSTTFSATDRTCRSDVPLAITMLSAMLVRPRTSITTTSRAFMSSRASSTVLLQGFFRH